jgi:hypothetical protein
MQKLIVQAFLTDRTRVANLTGSIPRGNFLRFRSGAQAGLDDTRFREFSGTPFNINHHGASHYNGASPVDGVPKSEWKARKREHMTIYTHWALDMYADILGELDKHMDIDGKSTVLDNTLAIYSGDNSDSTQHGNLSQPCIIGGRGGMGPSGWRVKSGRQLKFADFGAGPTASERSWKDLLWGAMNILGVPDPDGSPRLKTFGYARRPLDVELGTG